MIDYETLFGITIYRLDCYFTGLDGENKDKFILFEREIDAIRQFDTYKGYAIANNLRMSLVLSYAATGRALYTFYN